MNKTRLIFAALILLVMLGASAVAQTRPSTTSKPTPTPPRPAATPLPTPVATNAPVPESRIALVDTVMFGDEKSGIYVYIDAAKKVELEFQPRTTELQSIQTRLTALANEINTLRQAKVVDPKTIQAKQSEGERLQQDLGNKKEKLDQDVAARYRAVVSPVSNQIGLALDQFARQRGVTMTLDMSKLLPAILTALPASDITQAFIEDFNRKNPRTGAAPRP
jgi:outer membrane protein